MVKQEQSKNPLEISDEAITVTLVSIENDYRVSYNRDGTGTVYCYDDYEEDQFAYNLDLAQVQAANPGEVALRNFLIDHFWSDINPNLSDPLIQDYDELDGYELEFQKGNQAEFDRLVHLFILTEPNIEQHTAEEVEIKAAAPEDEYYSYENYGVAAPENEGEESPPCLIKWSYYSERLNKLVNLALKEHRPYGYMYEYNDQAYDRFSGYSMTTVRMEYMIGEILEAPAREKMAARQQLTNWLIERGQNPSDYGLDWEKIV